MKHIMSINIEHKTMYASMIFIHGSTVLVDQGHLYSATVYLTSVIDGGGWLTPRSGRFTPREWPDIFYILGKFH